MNIFEQYLAERFVAELNSWPAEISADLYILMIDIGFSCDDRRAAQFGLRYNTLSNYNHERTRVSDPNEAKWNSAFWISSPLEICKQPFMHGEILEEHSVDWRGVGLRDAYYVFARDHMSNDPVENIVDACAHVAAQLHLSQDVAAVCGRAIPIVLEINNDYNCEEYLARKNREVNPLELVEEYLSFWGRN